MPDTKVRRDIFFGANNGPLKRSDWYDVDNPSTFYATRREARDARRGFILAQPRQKTLNITKVGFKDNTSTVLSSLQQRLYDRLLSFGVQDDEALDTILNNGYNAAASYGYMRRAGATHDEATIVISLQDPRTSVSYGLERANGLLHMDALAKAING